MSHITSVSPLLPQIPPNYPYEHGTFNRKTHKAVPKDAIVLDLETVDDFWAADDFYRSDKAIHVIAALRYAAKGDKFYSKKVMSVLADQIEAQTTPPRMAEPTAPGSRVRDSRGVFHTRFSSKSESVLGDWITEDGLIRHWYTIDSPVPA